MDFRYLSTHYLEIFLSRVNPLARGMGLSHASFQNGKYSKPILLQYNAALASAARFTGDKDLYPRFGERATQLASELIADFSVETAIGFYLHSFYLWGESDLKACHYRDITASLYKRISHKNSFTNPRALLLLEFGVTSIMEFDYLPHTTVELEHIVERFRRKIPQEFFLELLSLKSAVNKKLFPRITISEQKAERVVSNNKTIPVNFITQDQCFEICGWLQKLGSMVTGEPLLGDERNVLSSVHLNTHYAILYHAAKEYVTSLRYVLRAVEAMETPGFQSFFSAQLIGNCHFLFLIAFQERKYTLANRISGLQRKLAMKLPAARRVFEKEMDMIRKVDLTFEDTYDLIPSLDQPNTLSTIPMSSSSLEIAAPSNLFSDCDFDINVTPCNDRNLFYTHPEGPPALDTSVFQYDDNAATNSFIASLLE